MAIDLSASLLYRIGADALRVVRRRRRRPPATEVVQLRQKWRPIFDAEICERRAKGLRQDVIVRDVKRIDQYPEVNENEKRISAWFRAGLVGIYHRGIQVGLSWQGLCWDDAEKKWRYADYRNDEKSDVTAALLGLIRYENIESVNWDGDEFYGYPHIYCHFAEKKRQPYERLAFFEHRKLDHIEYFSEIVGLHEVDRYSRKLKVGRYAY